MIKPVAKNSTEASARLERPIERFGQEGSSGES